MADKVIKEFRGVTDLVYAIISEDSTSAYTAGEVKPLSGVAQVAKTTETSSETKYYDNSPAIVITGEGSDTLTIDVSVISMEVLAELTGKLFEATTGTLVDGEGKPVYLALGYKTEATDGSERYVWRHKGRVAVPDETNVTKNAGTDANGQQLVYTGIATTHPFTANDGRGAKGIVVDTKETKLTPEKLAQFFDEAQTIDTLVALAATESASAGTGDSTRSAKTTK